MDPAEAPNAAATEAMKNGLRDDYLELKEKVREELKKKINGSADARTYMVDFFRIAMRVRNVEYNKKAEPALYENAVMELSEIYENAEKIPVVIAEKLPAPAQ